MGGSHHHALASKGSFLIEGPIVGHLGLDYAFIYTLMVQNHINVTKYFKGELLGTSAYVEKYTELLLSEKILKEPNFVKFEIEHLGIYGTQFDNRDLVVDAIFQLDKHDYIDLKFANDDEMYVNIFTKSYDGIKVTEPFFSTTLGD